MAVVYWPSKLWIIRHGESAGNVARNDAHSRGAHRIDLASRDVDIELSAQGERQAIALGKWFSRESDRPEILLASPYVRAAHTARLFRDAGGAAREERICVDERLREKEFGILDGLTTDGVALMQPEQAEFRRLLGKFYHRPPGGESWCDVIFRLRSLLDTIALHYADRRVMIVAHQVVVLCMRYIIENLNEDEILSIDRAGEVANGSVTEYRFDPKLGRDGGLTLIRYNDVTHLENLDSIRITAEPERTGGVRG